MGNTQPAWRQGFRPLQSFVLHQDVLSKAEAGILLWFQCLATLTKSDMGVTCMGRRAWHGKQSQQHKEGAMLKQLLTISALLCASLAFADIDVNQATLAELDAVKGIGPALSQRILAQRHRALFIDWPDLIDRVHGIGNTSASKFSAQGLTVNGRSFPGNSAPVPDRLPALPPAAREKPDRGAPFTPP